MHPVLLLFQREDAGLRVGREGHGQARVAVEVLEHDVPRLPAGEALRVVGDQHVNLALLHPPHDRQQPGELLLESIQAAARKHKIQNGVIVSDVPVQAYKKVYTQNMIALLISFTFQMYCNSASAVSNN